MTESLRIEPVADGRDVRLVLIGELTFATVSVLAREVEQVVVAGRGSDPLPFIVARTSKAVNAADLTKAGNFKEAKVGRYTLYENQMDAKSSFALVDDKTPITNLYLSMLERVGITASRFGDSTGKLTALTV